MHKQLEAEKKPKNSGKRWKLNFFLFSFILFSRLKSQSEKEARAALLFFCFHSFKGWQLAISCNGTLESPIQESHWFRIYVWKGSYLIFLYLFSIRIIGRYLVEKSRYIFFLPHSFSFKLVKVLETGNVQEKNCDVILLIKCRHFCCIWYI